MTPTKCCEKCFGVGLGASPVAGEVITGCTNNSCPCHTATTADWEIEFDEEYGALPIEGWSIGFVASVITEDTSRPKFGEGSSRDFLTEKLIKKFRTLVAEAEERGREEILKNIGFLRQWLNEDRIDSLQKSVDNEQIRKFLLIGVSNPRN